MSEKRAPLTKTQADFLTGILTARAQIERDFQTAAGIIAGSIDLDLKEGMQYRIEDGAMVFTTPDTE